MVNMHNLNDLGITNHEENILVYLYAKKCINGLVWKRPNTTVTKKFDIW